MKEIRGKNDNGEYTEYQINKHRSVVVQRRFGDRIWFIYDSMRGVKGKIRTAGHDVKRSRAEQQAKAYIQGLKNAGTVVR